MAAGHHALGSRAGLVGQAAQGIEARDVQRASGDRPGETVLPRRLQTFALSHSLSGYYEWHYSNPDDKKEKPQPYYFSRRDGQLMTFAGVYDTWHDRAEKKNIQSCAMVIAEPNKFVAEVHDRMPVILERDQFDTWLRTNDVREAAAMLKPAGEDVLIRRPVSKRINSSKTTKDDPTLIAEVTLAA
jgi:putative SOS response-associated peptidase YedK